MGQSAQSSLMPRASVLWQVQSPPRAHANEEPGLIPDWVEAIRSLRGSVLYADGRRPQFKIADGRCYDFDPLDLHAYHVLAYQNHQLVGCVRIYPLAFHTGCCTTETLLGKQTFAQMLLELGAQQTTTVEVSRWVVHPDHRTGGLAVQLAAGAVALGRYLGLPLVICSAGT